MYKKTNWLLFLFIGMVSINGQTITCSPVDKQLFERKMAALQKLETESYADTIIAIGKSFLKTPYVEKTLEVGEKETLVVNLRGFDCTTFVENVLALSLLHKNGEADFDSFVDKLETIRYRDGKLKGYPSRLHYFTEWIRNNNEKSLVEDITADLGGEIQQKPINFIGTHRNLYPFLEDDSNFEQMLQVENELAKETLCILPQKEIQPQEHNIQNGDIIALATSIKGLDVTHTGFAIKVDGRLHLLHASSAGEVTITKEPLVDYLKKIKNNIGIIVARPLAH